MEAETEIKVGEITLKCASEVQQFDTGAVRDSTIGKGSISLVSPFVVRELLKIPDYEVECLNAMIEEKGAINTLWKLVGDYQIGDYHLRDALFVVLNVIEYKQTGDYTYFQVPPIGMMELSKLYEAGAEKYTPHNWTKGIPAERCLDSFFRHLCKWSAGWIDERHDIACAWNLAAIIHYEATVPEMVDIYWRKYGDK